VAEINLCNEVLENAISVHRTLEKIEPPNTMDIVSVKAMEELLEYRKIGTVEEFKALKNVEGKTVYLINNNTDSCCGCESLVVGDDYCDKCQIAYPQCSEKSVCEKQYLEVVELKASAKWIFDNTESFGRTVFLTREEAEQALKQICEEET